MMNGSYLMSNNPPPTKNMAIVPATLKIFISIGAAPIKRIPICLSGCFFPVK